jgi:Domain of unknown function (DUF4185)
VATTERQVIGAVRREETTVRPYFPSGYFAPTWTADGEQLVTASDGKDLAIPPTKAYHNRIYRVVGVPPQPAFEEVPGYPYMPLRLRESEYASFWGGPCLAVDGTVYLYLPTSNTPYLKPDGSFWPDWYLAHTKLIYSPDNGATWHNQDGSTPVVWDNWSDVSPDNMVFYDEKPDGAFAWLTCLQMGQDYAANEDGYVYVYSTNGGDDGTANQLVMFRVPKTSVLDRDAYEFFSGLAADGSATWTSDIAKRAPVHVFPPGWVSNRMPGAAPAGWWVSAVYNQPLGVYMLAASGTGLGPTGGWFGKPSYLGFWTARTPWGPFTQIHEELAWTPEGELASRAFQPQIPPKWISNDGTSFWLVWSDYGLKPTDNDPKVFNRDKEVIEVLKDITDDDEFVREWAKFHERRALHTSFNMQRVDLLVDDESVVNP